MNTFRIGVPTVTRHKEPEYVMPEELKERIADAIEPHTIRVEADHEDVMRAIEIAYPLIAETLEAGFAS